MKLERTTGIHICFSPPLTLMTQESAENSGALCCSCTWSGFRGTEEGGPMGLAVNPGQQSKAAAQHHVHSGTQGPTLTLLLHFHLSNIMQISFLANSSPEPYKKGNLGKWNSSLVKLTEYKTTARNSWGVVGSEASIWHTSTWSNHLYLPRMLSLPLSFSDRLCTTTNWTNLNSPWLHGAYKQV